MEARVGQGAREGASTQRGRFGVRPEELLTHRQPQEAEENGLKTRRGPAAVFRAVFRAVSRAVSRASGPEQEKSSRTSGARAASHARTQQTSTRASQEQSNLEVTFLEDFLTRKSSTPRGAPNLLHKNRNPKKKRKRSKRRREKH